MIPRDGIRISEDIMSMLMLPVQLIDDGTGIEFQAPLATCACSNIDPEVDEGLGSEAFYVFWDHRFNPAHLHVQCYDCWQTYCPYQQCVPPPTAEVFGA
jgi:hypothetical protein